MGIDMLYRIVGGGIEFEDVERPLLVEGLATFTVSACLPVFSGRETVDSLEHEEEIVLDENGEPVIRKNEDTGNPSESTTTGSGDDKATTPTEKKKKSKPRIEEVRFEDL